MIFFDEIQIAPRVLTSLKYFQEQAPEFHIIAAGSLLGVSMGKESGFPVGEVNFLTLFPMSFTEYLIEVGEGLLYYWTSKSDAEVDFLVESNQKIIPLEVKSGTSRNTKSLKSYASKYYTSNVLDNNNLNVWIFCFNMKNDITYSINETT